MSTLAALNLTEKPYIRPQLVHISFGRFFAEGVARCLMYVNRGAMTGLASWLEGRMALSAVPFQTSRSNHAVVDLWQDDPSNINPAH